jgi:hypothetical protein
VIILKKTIEPVRLTWSPSAQAVFGLLQYTDKKELYSLADIMFITNSAFMINIHPVTVYGAGPTLFSPFHLMGSGLLAMGFDIGVCFSEIPATPEQLEVYVNFVKNSVDKGLPVIGWDLFCPEFGIIYGYDHDKQELYARDAERDGIIPYSEINNRRFTCIHATAILDSNPVDPMDTFHDSLLRAIQFSDETNRPLSSDYRHGIPGYDAWIQAFTTKHIDIPENAYNLAVVADGRAFAAQFFKNFPNSIFGQTPLGSILAPYAAEAALYYRQTSDTLAQLLPRFPFPHGGEPNDPQEAELAIQLLIKAKSEETNGVTIMKKMLDVMTTHNGGRPLSLGKFRFNTK